MHRFCVLDVNLTHIVFGFVRACKQTWFQGIRACYINLHAALKERVNLISRATDAHAHRPSSRANKEESAAEARREMEWL